MDLSPAQFRAQISLSISDGGMLEQIVADYARRYRARNPRVIVPPEPAKSPKKSYEDRMAEASATLLDAIKGVHCGITVRTSPALIWTRETGLDSNNGHGGNSDLYQPEVYVPRVTRDPCTYCGTRADIGCQHRRVA